MVLNLEPDGTTTSENSPVRRASGVTSFRVTAALLVRNEATMPKPPTIMALGSPFWVDTNWAMPTPPPAPTTLATVTFLASPRFCSTVCIEREVRS